MNSQVGERVHKVLAREGWGSRREIERWVSAGRIRVNGEVAQVGARVKVGDQVHCDDGRAMCVGAPTQGIKVLAFNKPSGTVCARRDPEGRVTVFECLPPLYEGRWIIVGRLDINTSGLLLFTNHGELAHRLMHPSYRIDREYAARIFGAVDKNMLLRLQKGVNIVGQDHRFDDIVGGEGTGANRWFYCVLQSGRQREVRRLWESQGVRVSRLNRVRFGNVMLPTDLRVGCSVELGGAILTDLCDLVGVKSG